MSLSRFYGLLALAAPVILLFSGCQRPAAVHAQAGMVPTVAVRVVPCGHQRYSARHRSIGNVEAIPPVDVKSRIAGQVAQVRFESGRMSRQDKCYFKSIASRCCARLPNWKRISRAM